MQEIKKEYIIETRVGDYDSSTLLGLWRDDLKHDERRLEWSYGQNATGAPTVYLIRESSLAEVFGSLTIFPRDFYWQHKRVRGGTTGDFVIERAHRSLGPALALQKHALQSLKPHELLLAFPNKPSEKVQMRAGFKPLGKMMVYYKPLRATHAVTRMAKSPLLKYVTPIGDILLRIRDLNCYWPDRFICYDNDQEIDIRFDRLSEDAGLRYSLMGDRQSRYLRWRFFKNRYETFNAFTVEDRRSALVAYAIYAIRENCACIDDFLWDGSKQAFDELFKGFTAVCRKKAYDAIYLIMLCNPEIDILLKKNGFFSKPASTRVLVADSRLSGIPLEGIFITKGDDDR